MSTKIVKRKIWDGYVFESAIRQDSTGWAVRVRLIAPKGVVLGDHQAKPVATLEEAEKLIARFYDKTTEYAKDRYNIVLKEMD